MIKRLFSELHADWMDDQDKHIFDSEMLRQFGSQVDTDITKGVADGFTVEQQEDIVRNLFTQICG